ncbi:MAG TPA: DsrE family protein [Cyclobacteriaceae bacterium]|nr:DsrE family protein [Cyclobacteriaceae bacterium]
MKNSLLIALVLVSFSAFSQKRINPVIKTYGTIFDIPFAEEKPDPNLDYKIIVEIERESERPDSVSWALNNVARLINLHVMAGVKLDQLHVVIAIHSGAIYTVMNNETYRNKYKVDNPNLGLFEELDKAGVRIVACGQSIMFRKVDRFKMAPQVKVASSMITTLTSYQMKGYAVLRF